jgi:hypothetical protein
MEERIEIQRIKELPGMDDRRLADLASRNPSLIQLQLLISQRGVDRFIGTAEGINPVGELQNLLEPERPIYTLEPTPAVPRGMDGAAIPGPPISYSCQPGSP